MIGLLLAGALLPLEPAAIDLADPIDARLLGDLDAIAASGVGSDSRPAVINRQRARRLSARVGRIVLALEGSLAFALPDLEQARSAACADVAEADTSAHLEHLGDQDNSLYAADTAHSFAEALEMAERAGLVCAGDLRQHLTAFSEDLFAGYTERMGLLFRSYQQNHTLKVAAGLLAARLVLDGVHDSEHPHNAWAVHHMTRIHHALTTLDGGYGEGPSYWAYQAINTVPVLFALGLSDPQCTLVDGPFDARLCQRVHANWRWALRISVPLEVPYFAPFDDSTPGAWFPFAMIPDPLAQAYGARRPIRSRPMAQLAWRLREAASVEIAAERAVVDYHAGQLGWVDEQEQALLLLQVEHGRAMGEGLDQVGDAVDGTAGHNQTAPLSLMWLRRGRWRVIDPGYLGWENRYPVARPGDHATIMIDGKAAQGPNLFTPSFTVDGEGRLTFDDPDREGGYVVSRDGAAFGEVHSAALTGLGEGWHLASGRTEFHVETPQTDWRRVVLRHRDGRLLVWDDVRVAQSAEVALRWQLPAGTEALGVGHWTVPAAGQDDAFEVRVSVAGHATAVTAEITEKVHDRWHWSEGRHEQVTVRVRGDRVQWLTSFLPVGAVAPVLRSDGGFRVPDGDPFEPLLDGWTLGTARFQEGIGLIDPEAGIVPLELPDAVTRGSAATDLLAAHAWRELEHFGACLEALEPDQFVAGEGDCDPGVARGLTIAQPHQAPHQVRVVAPAGDPPSKPDPEPGCGCRNGQSSDLLFALLLFAYLTRRTRRA
jgi:hypothetical protein